VCERFQQLLIKNHIYYEYPHSYNYRGHTLRVNFCHSSHSTDYLPTRRANSSHSRRTATSSKFSNFVSRLQKSDTSLHFTSTLITITIILSFVITASSTRGGGVAGTHDHTSTPSSHRSSSSLLLTNKGNRARQGSKIQKNALL
jgi:hypothetical protein